YLPARLQRLAQPRAQPLLVDVELLEQRVGREVHMARRLRMPSNHRLERRAEERPLDRQVDRRRRLVELHEHARRRRVAYGERVLLELADDGHDAAILEPRLIVEVAPKLLGEARDGALRDLAGAQPIVVDALQTRVRCECRDGVEIEDMLEQRAELFLSRAGHQEIPEREEAAALVGRGDRVVLAEDLLENFPLTAFGARDALTHLPVELAEVVLDLAKVCEQRACRVRGLHETIAYLRRLEQRKIARANAFDLGVELRAAALELLDPRARIGLAAFDDLAQQVEYDLEPRLGTDERTLLEPREPVDRALGRGRQVVMRLVGIGRIVAPQPTSRVVGPVGEV